MDPRPTILDYQRPDDKHHIQSVDALHLMSKRIQDFHSQRGTGERREIYVRGMQVGTKAEGRQCGAENEFSTTRHTLADPILFD